LHEAYQFHIKFLLLQISLTVDPFLLYNHFSSQSRIGLPPAFMFVSYLARSILKIEAICSSKTSVDFQWTTQHYSPEDSALHNLGCYSWCCVIIWLLLTSPQCHQPHQKHSSHRISQRNTILLHCNVFALMYNIKPLHPTIFVSEKCTASFSGESDIFFKKPVGMPPVEACTRMESCFKQYCDVISRFSCFEFKEYDFFK
jgi:hypothetical protein